MPDETIHKHDEEPSPVATPNTVIKVIIIAVICLVLSFFTLELVITTQLDEHAEELLEDYLPWFVTGAVLTVAIVMFWVYRLRRKKRGKSPFISR